MNSRVRLLNDAPFRPQAKYVLYWALAHRRVDSNHGLWFAAELANEHGLPLLMYEALTCEHPFANDRFHTFVLEGVGENGRRAKAMGVGYVFYARWRRSDPDDILYRLAADAAAVVTDDYPTYLPRDYNSRVPAKVGVPYYVVDSNGAVPMSELGKQQYAAYTIRPRIQRLLPKYLEPVPTIRMTRRFSGAPPAFHTAFEADAIPRLIAASDIDHSVPPSQTIRGGRRNAEERLSEFLEHSLHRYAKHARQPSERATSGLSPYLHFGHISALEVAIAVRDYAEGHRLIATEFLEELIVRRELAFNFARYGPDPRTLAALPEWAQITLAKHARDRRDPIYSPAQFERAETHDPLWNAAQQELLRDGVIHGYYRMYWGKKIVEWSASHQEALNTMLFLNDRYALDGRDPNTYTNILWCLGLHDRPWPERPVFGMIRYMSGDGMKRKTDVEAYVASQAVR